MQTSRSAYRNMSSVQQSIDPSLIFENMMVPLFLYCIINIDVFIM